MASVANPGQGGSAPPLAVQRGIVKMPWGFPAREFLRKKLIGKEVCFTVEYKTPQGREYGMVYLGKGEHACAVRAAWEMLHFGFPLLTFLVRLTLTFALGLVLTRTRAVVSLQVGCQRVPWGCGIAEWLGWGVELRHGLGWKGPYRS
uniref:Uncharacterized protein n=1 Tax=Meleagris gallopavo TaxID=9103 RepID=A0A803XYA3_MELGA